MGSAELVSKIRLFGMKDMTGAVMAPFNAMLILRGLKTLELRMDRHCASAMTVARLLENSYGVDKVWYPGLASFEQNALAQRQMAQFGGMIAFELAGGIDAGRAMMNKLQLITRAVSLGDAETLIQHPASMTHSTYTPKNAPHMASARGLCGCPSGLKVSRTLSPIWSKRFLPHPSAPLPKETAMTAHLKSIEQRLLWLSHWMIHNANHIRPKADGIKVGGHQASLRRWCRS